MDAKTLLLIAGVAYIGYKLGQPKTGKRFNELIKNDAVDNGINIHM